MADSPSQLGMTQPTSPQGADVFGIGDSDDDSDVDSDDGAGDKSMRRLYERGVAADMDVDDDDDDDDVEHCEREGERPP